MSMLLKQLRKEKGLSQAQLANELRVHQTAVSQWECGRTRPDRDTIVRLAAFYRVSTDLLLGIEM